MGITSAEIASRFKGSFTVSNEFIDLLTDLYKDVNGFSVDRFGPFDLNQIYAYLKASHAYYIGECLPAVSEALDEVVAKHGSEADAEKLRKFVKHYKAELYEHIEIEEQVILQFVSELLAGKYDHGNRDFFFNHFLHTHNDEIVSSLDQIKASVEENSSLSDDQSFVRLFDLLTALKRDLEIHNLIEDEVFVLKTLDYVNSNFPQESDQ